MMNPIVCCVVFALGIVPSTLVKGDNVRSLQYVRSSAEDNVKIYKDLDLRSFSLPGDDVESIGGIAYNPKYKMDSVIIPAQQTNGMLVVHEAQILYS